MVRRIFSIILSVDRGLPQEDIIDWIDNSLQGVVEFNSFHTLAVTYYPVRELIYGQLHTLNLTSVSESRIREFLSSPPEGIRVVEVTRLETRDKIVDLPLPADAKSGVSRLGNSW